MRFWFKHDCFSSRRGAVAVFIIIMLGLLLIQACILNGDDKAPDFTLLDLDGNEVRLSEFRDKVVLINFWTTWCPPCRAEMPEIESLYQEYKDKGLVIIGIDIGEPEARVRQFVQRGGYSWTFVLDSNGAVMADYKIRKIPTSFFIDRKGVIQAENIGAMTKQGMEAILAELLLAS